MDASLLPLHARSLASMYRTSSNAATALDGWLSIFFLSASSTAKLNEAAQDQADKAVKQPK